MRRREPKRSKDFPSPKIDEAVQVTMQTPGREPRTGAGGPQECSWGKSATDGTFSDISGHASCGARYDNQLLYFLYFLYIFCWHSSQYPPTSVRDTVTFILKSRAICCFSCS